MSSFPVVRPSLRMETPFPSIMERLILAWRWLRAAFAPLLRGWICIAVQQEQGRFNGNAKLILAQLAPSGALVTPRMSSLYLGRILRGGLTSSR